MKYILTIVILLFTLISCSESKDNIARANIKQFIINKAFKENISNVDFIILDIIEIKKVSGKIIEYNKRIVPLIKELEKLNVLAEEKNKEMERLVDNLNILNVTARKTEIEYMKENQDKIFAQMKRLHSKIDSIENVVDTMEFDSVYRSKVFMKAIFTYNNGHKENAMDTIYPIFLNNNYQVIP